MTSRRTNNNQIRGPQSALTDFLASNNISAAQISRDNERRQAEISQQDARRSIDRNVSGSGSGKDRGSDSDDSRTHLGISVDARKRKRELERATARSHMSKGTRSANAKKGQKPGSEGGNGSTSMDTHRKPLPGQLENCDDCQKRFTVTPYSRTGPGGNLLCAKCSKEQEDGRKRDLKAKNSTSSREKRRQTQSALLDGILQVGSRSLQDICISVVANNISDIEELGDLPGSLLKSLSQILSRRRAITSQTLDLFLRPDLETIDIYDCASLQTEDYKRMVAVVPHLQKLNLRNAGQLKDDVLEYIIERHGFIKDLELHAANLVSNAQWTRFFEACGCQLQTLKLSWLDNAMNDETFICLARHCLNLRRLKLVKCFKLGNVAMRALVNFRQLQHLSLLFKEPVSSEVLVEVISTVGPNLRSLSLRSFDEADDNVLEAIKASCGRLVKLRFTNNDCCNDAAFAHLFSDWSNPPLSNLDLSSNRSTDYSAPDGPENPVGLASAGFQALMDHSGSSLERLDISSCRHIEHKAFSAIFDGTCEYSALKELNISFLTNIDTPLLTGVFRTCPRLTKLTAFGCFNIIDITVPRGIALIGVPNAQNSIFQEGNMESVH